MNNGMIIRHDHQNEYWPDDIYWPVVNRFLQKGWRSGKTRVYTLQCGHRYHCPAANHEGRGKTAHCTFCTSLWRWITSERSGIGDKGVLKGIHAAILTGMLDDARRLGKLVRSPHPSWLPEPGVDPEAEGLKSAFRMMGIK